MEINPEDAVHPARSRAPGTRTSRPSRRSERAPEHPIRLLFIAGSGRSGSTLLDLLLGDQPEARSLGEVRHLWREGELRDRRCGCGDTLHRCSFWSAVMRDALGPRWRRRAREIAALQEGVDRLRHLPVVLLGEGRTGGLSSDRKAYGQALTTVYRAIARRGEASWLIDSSSDPSHGAWLVSLQALEVAVVHLVRDSRGVAHSWTRHKHNPSTGRPMDRHPTWRSARDWMLNNAAAECLRLRATQYIRLRYEDFVSEPEPWLRRIRSEVMGLSRPHAFLDDGGRFAMPGDSHLIAGNPAKYADGPISIRNDDAWRDHMSDRDRALVTAITFPLLARHGYL